MRSWLFAIGAGLGVVGAVSLALGVGPVRDCVPNSLPPNQCPKTDLAPALGSAMLGALLVVFSFLEAPKPGREEMPTASAAFDDHC